jgi:hypothetical protein
MTTKQDRAPTPDDISMFADVAGVAIDAAAAARIAQSIGPALRGFHDIAGTLPFDLEPATFVVVQNGGKP